MSLIKRLALGASIAVLVTACSQPADDDATTAVAPAAETAAPAAEAANEAAETETARLNAWFEQVFQDGIARSPMYQTFLGMKTNYDQWGDASPEFAQESYEIGQQNYQYMLANFDFDQLDESAQISWRLFERNALRDQDGQRWVDHGYTFTPRSGPHMNTPTFLINNHRVDTLEDAEAYIGRLNGMGDYLDQHIANARRSAELGVYTPRWTWPSRLNSSHSGTSC